MVKIYTSLDKIPKYYDVDRFPASAYDLCVAGDDLDVTDFEAVDKFENIEIQEIKYGEFDSSLFFIGKDKSLYYRDLSGGLKTLIYIRWLKRNYEKDKTCVNVSGCSQPILEHIFEEVDGTNISLLLRHVDVLSCKDREYLVNSRRKVDTAEKLKKVLIETL